MKKSVFLKTKASPLTKKLSIVAWILLGLCLLTMAFSIYNAHFGDSREIPAFKIVLGDKAEELNNDLEESFNADNTLQSPQQQAAENLINRFSFNNLLAFAEVTNDINIDALAEIINIFLAIAAALCVFAFALTLFAVWLKNNIFTVASFIFSLIATFICGTLPLIFAAILHIALFVIIHIINKEYRPFKNKD